MARRWSATLAPLALVLFVGPGCRTSGFRNPAIPSRPEPILPRAALDPREAFAAFNENARRVSNMRADTSVTAKSLATKEVGAVRGRLALERDNRFRMQLESPGTGLVSVADIGSNGEEFWFWVKNNPDNAIYVCAYDPDGDSPLAASLQPDWIIESMGLKILTDDEIAGITTRVDGPYTVFSQKRRGADGQSTLKETWVRTDESQIVEHRLYAIDPKGQKVGLAQAIIKETQAVAVPPAEGDDPSQAVAPVVLPKSARLVWFQQKFQLDILLKDVELNKPFSESVRTALFTEPTIRGYQRKDIRVETAQATPRIPRRTRPVPALSGHGRAALGDPEPIGGEPETPKARTRGLGDSQPQLEELPPLTSLIVGERHATPAEPEGVSPVQDVAPEFLDGTYR